MDIGILIGGIVVSIVVCLAGIFILRMAFIANTEGAVNRLSAEIAAATEKQTELSLKLKEADEELARKKEEARQLANKMRQDAEEASAAEREEIINKARQEAEDIIAKAQGTKDTIRKDIQKEESMKIIEYSTEIVNRILSKKVKGALDETLVDEFMENFKSVDMSRIAQDINEVEVVTVNPLPDSVKNKIGAVIKEKTGRSLTIKTQTDDKIGGGVIVKFGTMALDGSIRNFIREESIDLKESAEKA